MRNVGVNLDKRDKNKMIDCAYKQRIQYNMALSDIEIELLKLKYSVKNNNKCEVNLANIMLIIEKTNEIKRMIILNNFKKKFKENGGSHVVINETIDFLKRYNL